MTGINSIRNTEETPLDKEDKNKTEEQYVMDFVKELKEINDSMVQFKEHRAELKKLFKENGWLTKEQMTAAAKALRMVEGENDIDTIKNYYELIKGKIGK